MTAVPAKVLVVDDDAHIRRLIKLYLREAGFDATDTGSGEEALALAEATPFDVVLVDLILPHFGGFRLCQKLKSAATPPRVVIMTGDDSQATRDAARDYGADAFLAKPFTREELLAAVSGRKAEG